MTEYISFLSSHKAEVFGYFTCLFSVYQVSWSIHQSPSWQDSLLHVGKILLQTQELSSVLSL